MKLRHLVLGAYFTLFAFPALAYVGPGVGLSLISSFFTLIGGVVLALLMVLYYPIRMALRRRKQKKAAGTGTPDAKQE